MFYATSSITKSNSNTKVSNHAKLSPINCSHQMQTHNNQFYNNYNILRYMMKIMLCFQQLYIYIYISQNKNENI